MDRQLGTKTDLIARNDSRYAANGTWGGALWGNLHKSTEIKLSPQLKMCGLPKKVQCFH